MSLRNVVKGIMTEQLNRRYRNALSAKQVNYHKWVTEEETAFFNEIPPKMKFNNKCNLCILYSSHGRLASRAEDVIQNFFENNPMVQMAYGDEDVEEIGRAHV